MFIWQEVQVLHQVNPPLLELVEFFLVVESVVRQESHCRVAYLMLQWLLKNLHRVLEGYSARFITDTSQDDDALGKVLLKVFEDDRRAFDQFVVEDLALLPGFRA